MMEKAGLVKARGVPDLPHVPKAAEAADPVPFNPEPVLPDPPVSVFPITCSISNHRGKTIDVIITGRTETELQFHSLRYNHDYSYPILDLSLKDQGFVRRLPIEEAVLK
jgi:hypothetical protein